MVRFVTGAVSFISLTILLISCPNLTGDSDDSPDMFAIVYDANGADDGAVPDSQTKVEGVNLTLASNTGNLVLSGHAFAGWNTADDGSGTNYPEGASYTADAGLTLYATWATLSTYTVTYETNGATSGSAPANQTKFEGVNLTLAENSDGLARDGFTFTGWNTAPNGTGTSYAEGAIYTDDADVTLYPMWWEVALEQLLASGVEAGDYFGTSVAISGDYAIVGASQDVDNDSNSGSAYIFHRTGTNTWDSGTRIDDSDGAAGDWFGHSIAISGDYAIVGAHNDDDNGTDSGSAYIFHRTGTNTWDSGTQITAIDGAADDSFGISVAISGDYAIVGANNDDDNGTDSGSAYIFHRTGTNTWDSGTRITASEGAADDRFGGSVSMFGDYAVVGAHNNDDNGFNSGSAYIFHRTGANTWDGGTKITASDGASGDSFGVSVAISGDYVVVGADSDDDNGNNSGSAYIFYRTGTNTWDAGTKITASEGAADDFFGFSVAISGNCAIVGAPAYLTGDSNSGSTHVFHRTGTNEWDSETQITTSDVAADDQFGCSVAIDGDYAVLGVEQDDDNGSNSGSAYVFITP